MGSGGRRKQFPERYVPADGSRLEDPELGYLIVGFRDDGGCAGPGERFHNACWSRDRSGTCANGDHGKCAHRRHGPHETGVLVEDAEGLAHVWRCGCACHREQDEANTRGARPVGVPARRDVTKRAGATIRDMSSSRRRPGRAVTKERVAAGGRYEPGTPLPARCERREDGKPYESLAVQTVGCGACGAPIAVRATGRPRRFCDATCRQRAKRATPTLF